jgi:hypothetical protein
MTAPRDLESLLARALRDPSQAGASTEAIAHVKAVGRAELARGGVPRHRWFSELLGAASDAVQAVLLHDRLAGAAPGFRASSTLRQRVFGAPVAPGVELDVESHAQGDGTVLVRGMVTGSETGSRTRLLVREQGDESGRELPVTDDGRFEFASRAREVQLVASVGSRTILVDGLELP